MSKQKNIGLVETYIWIIISIGITIILAAGGVHYEILKDLYKIIYVGSFFIFLLVATLIITSYDTICGKQDAKLAFISSLYPFSFIFLIGVSLLELFPGWIRGFSNTIGMWCINLGGFKEFSYSLLKKNGGLSQSDIPNILLEKLYNNHTPLFNEITTNHIDGSGNLNLPPSLGNILNLHDGDIQSLKEFIYIKELIGRLIWYTLLSIITFFVAINNILNSEKCINKSSDDSSKFKNYLSSNLDD